MAVRKLLVAGVFVAFDLIGYALWTDMAKPVVQSEIHLPTLPPPADINAREKWFLDYINQIANYPNISEADELAKVLQSQFTIKHSEMHFEKECGAYNSQTANSRVIETDYYTPDKDFWFKAMPGGVQHMHLAGGGIFNTKPQDLGDPIAGFYILKITTCGGRHRTNPEISVHINFTNIPGFVCITQNQLKTLSPQVERDDVSDGGVMYSYLTRSIEESGVLVNFTYPTFSMANECLLGVSIEQGERYSKKAKRVHKEFWNCLNAKHVDSSDPQCGGGIPEITNKE